MPVPSRTKRSTRPPSDRAQSKQAAGGQRKLSEVARHVVIPSGVVTTGWPRVEAQLAEMGIQFDEWQAGLSRIVLGKRADGMYAATVGGVVLSIPRQVGKTFTVGALIIALCVLFPGTKVLWTAHRTRTATNTFQSMQGTVKRRKVAPHLAKNGIRTANGEQQIAFANGSVIMFGAREQGFGRGFDEVDIEVFDEAQILTEKALDDMIAATNQARHPHGALLFYMGTPPRPGVDPGDAFTAKRRKALTKRSTDMIYVECSADPGADPDDRKQWAIANPSYPHRTRDEAMERMRENLLSDESWMREAFGIWDDDGDSRVISAEAWERLLAPGPDEDARPDALAVDMSPGDRSLVVAACWLGEEVSHVELVSSAIGADATKVADMLAEQARRIPVVLYAGGAAGALIPTLKQAGVKVIAASASDMCKAAGLIYDEVHASRMTHAGQPQLDTSVAGARRRAVGNGGAWGWDFKNSKTDIAPLGAVTLALWGAADQPARRPAIY
jgi:hypothetical protein